MERKPFNEINRDELAKIAVVVAAGIVAEAELCSRIGNQDMAVADDRRQWEGIQRIGSFSDEEMEKFGQEATEIVCAQERVIRKMALELDRKNKLTGERVTQIMERHFVQREFPPKIKVGAGSSLW